MPNTPKNYSRDTFSEYLERHEKNGIVDFRLRLVRTPEGLLDFYMYPMGKDGETGDFHVSGTFVSKLEVAAGSSRPTIQLYGSAAAHKE